VGVVNLYFTMYGSQSAIVHFPTFSVEGRSDILVNAMRACGALYLKTRQAVLFVNETLGTP